MLLQIPSDKNLISWLGILKCTPLKVSGLRLPKANFLASSKKKVTKIYVYTPINFYFILYFARVSQDYKVHGIKKLPKGRKSTLEYAEIVS